MNLATFTVSNGTLAQGLTAKMIGLRLMSNKMIRLADKPPPALFSLRLRVCLWGSVEGGFEEFRDSFITVTRWASLARRVFS